MSPHKENNLFFSDSSNFYLSPQTSMLGKLPFGFSSVGRGYMKQRNARKSNILYSGNYNIWEFFQILFGFTSKYREIMNYVMKIVYWFTIPFTSNTKHSAT